MPVYNYIILSDSDLQTVKRFKAIGLREPIQRTDGFNITVGGKVDKAAGTLLYLFQYVLRIPAESDNADYGTYDDLKAFFELTDPNGTPSDLITLTDHYGNQHYVKFNEDITPEPLTTQLNGPNAWHTVSVSFIEVGTVGGSGS